MDKIESVHGHSMSGYVAAGGAEEEAPERAELGDVRMRVLEDCKGRVHSFVCYAQLRQAMCELYNGGPEHEWFVDEVVECLPGFVDKEAGVHFVARVDEKMKSKGEKWKACMLENVEFLVRFECGLPIVRQMFDTMGEEVQYRIAVVLVNGLNWLKGTSMVARRLLRDAIELRPYDVELYKPIIEYDWLKRRDKVRFLCVFLGSVGLSVYLEFVQPVLDDLEYYAGDKDLQRVVVAMVGRGPQNVRNSVFEYLVELPDEKLLDSVLKPVYLAMIYEITHDQLEIFLLKLMRFWNSTSRGLHATECLLAALSMCPLREKLKFMLDNEERLRNLDMKVFGTELMCAESSLHLYRADFH